MADSLVFAELDSLEASLRRDQRDFSAAEALLNRSSIAYRLGGRPEEVAKNLLKLSYVHFHAGDVSRAIETLYEALNTRASREDPRLELWMRHNLALYLVDAEDVKGAKRVVAESEALYRSFRDPRTRLRRRWLLGRIARAEGKYREGEAMFRETARGFEALGDGYDAALVLLELAELHYASGSNRKLRDLAVALSPLLNAEYLHQEAIAALLLVQRAIRDQIVTATLLRRARLYLDEAKNNPALKFEDI